MSLKYTFALIKAHVAQKPTIVSSVLQRGLYNGLALRRLDCLTLSVGQINTLYQEHLERSYWADLALSVTGPCIGIIWTHPTDAVGLWRRLLGPTAAAQGAIPETDEPLPLSGSLSPEKVFQATIRSKWGDRNCVANNVAHGSDSEQAARREIGIVFPGSFSGDALRE